MFVARLHRDDARGVAAAQPGILRFYAEETPGLKIGPTTVTRPRRSYRNFIYCRIDGVTVVEIPPARRRRDCRRMRLTPRTRRS